MRVHRLRLANYRGVESREVAFAEHGVTVVHGPNEVGKSSLAEALDLLLEHYDDSKKAAVRAVKPVHRDAGAEIEAEISAGPYRFTYFKRFHRQSATQLTVHTPRAEQLTGREAHERVRTILAETVDLALWRALRIVQGQSLEQPDLGEVNALAAALDLAAGTDGGAESGEREQGVLERVQQEHARWFTPTGQENAALKGLRAAHEAAAEDLAGATAALAALERDVERCAAIARELDTLRPEQTEHAARLVELERRWADVQQRVAGVERLALRAERAEDAAAAGRRALAARTELVEALERAQQDHEVCRQEVATAAPALEQALAEATALRDEVERLRAELAAAREAERAAAEAEAQSRDAFSLELLDERWQRVSAARAAAAQARAVRDSLRIDDAALAEIEAAHLLVVQASARLADDSPSLRLRVQEHTTVELDGEDLVLRPGEEHELPVSDARTLRVGPVEAVLSPGQGTEALRARLDAAEQAYRDACERAAVGDVHEARDALRRRQDAERVLEHAERTVADNLRDLSLDELEDKRARLRERVRPSAGVDVDAAKRAKHDAEADVRRLESELAETEARLSAAARLRDELRDGQAAASLRLEAAAERLAAARQALEAARADVDDTALAARVGGLDEEARAAAQAHALARQELDADDPTGVEAALDNARAVVDKQQTVVRELEDELNMLQGRLSALGEQGLADRLAEAESRAEHAARAWSRAEQAAAAVRLLHDTLVRHRETARRAYAAPLRDKITSLGRIVYGPDFAVELDDELRVARRTLHGVTLDVEQLSTGAKEQLAVLTRLAVGAITARDGGVPVLLDDALGWSDPDRILGMAAALSVAARDSQIIVLTCVPERYRQIGSATEIRLS